MVHSRGTSQSNTFVPARHLRPLERHETLDDVERGGNAGPVMLRQMG